jgi:hypothetical protein
MPECIECGDKFPNLMLIEGRMRNLQRRKRCLSCLPFGKRWRTPIERRIDICVSCGVNKQILAKGKCSACYVRERSKRIKNQAIEYKGGMCYACGYNACDSALCFHHLDSSTKEIYLNGIDKSFETIKPELDKCVLLCRNCHAEVHSGYRKL